MKRIIVISLFVIITALIVILPYRESTQILLPADLTLKDSIYKDIAAIFTSKVGWTYISFLFVLLPLALLLQIKQSPLRWYKRMFFLLEGIIALFAASVMSYIMSFSIPLESATFTPIFYAALCWVLLGAIASILLAIKKLYDKACKLMTSA
jgi:hypothetical protein